MKIILDAYQYSPSITGTDRLAFNYLAELQKIDKKNSYTVLCSSQRYTRSAVHSPSFKVVKPPLICELPFFGRYFSYIWRRLMKIWLINMKAEVYFSFHNMTLPGRRIARQMIASNLDLIPVVFPEEYGHLGRATPEKHMAEYHRVADLADKFISISEFSKAELHSRIKVPVEKIKVIHLAADQSFFEETKSSTQSLPKKYIFTIGGSEPRKNVQTIIDAYMQLPVEQRENYQLLIAGGKWHEKNLDDYKNKDIIQLGFVSDEGLPRLYSNASLFVFASTYEGFGFALLEAMATKTPLICATGSSLDEVSDNAALHFEPKDTKELSKKINQVLSDGKLQKELIYRGSNQVARFSWDKSAKELHKILTEEIKE